MLTVNTGEGYTGLLCVIFYSPVRLKLIYKQKSLKNTNKRRVLCYRALDSVTIYSEKIPCICSQGNFLLKAVAEN